MKPHSNASQAPEGTSTVKSRNRAVLQLLNGSHDALMRAHALASRVTPGLLLTGADNSITVRLQPIDLYINHAPWHVQFTSVL